MLTYDSYTITILGGWSHNYPKRQSHSHMVTHTHTSQVRVYSDSFDLQLKQKQAYTQ